MLGDKINLLNHLTNRSGKMAKRTGRTAPMSLTERILGYYGGWRDGGSAGVYRGVAP
jgi:hypothetical protein